MLPDDDDLIANLNALDTHAEKLKEIEEELKWISEEINQIRKELNRRTVPNEERCQQLVKKIKI